MEKSHSADRTTHHAGNTNMVLIAVVVAIVALLLGGGVGYALGHITATKSSKSRDMASNMDRKSPFGGRFGGANGTGGFSGFSSRLTGAVTAVSGSSFTMIGDGGQYTINTDSSTTWEGGDSSVAVNDTVMVSYSGSGSTLTAKSIRVTSSLPNTSSGSTQSTTIPDTSDDSSGISE